MLCMMAVVGCVSKGTHTQTLTELEAAKKTSAQLQQQLAGLQKNLDQEAAQRKAAEQQAAELQHERTRNRWQLRDQANCSLTIWKA